MDIITKEHLAETFIKNIFADLHSDYTELITATGSKLTFDEFVYSRLADLGEAVYTLIGSKYGNCDNMAQAVMVE